MPKYTITFEAEIPGNENSIFRIFARQFRVKSAVLSEAQDDPNTVLGNIQNVADDYAADQIEQLAIKAGYWWKCGDEDCGCVMPVTENKCAACDKPKAEDRPACPNCEQHQSPHKKHGHMDCFNECAHRGFAPKVPL